METKRTRAPRKKEGHSLGGGGGRFIKRGEERERGMRTQGHSLYGAI